MQLKKLGILGLISLMSYSAMVFLSPIAYPGYNSLSMAVSTNKTNHKSLGSLAILCLTLMMVGSIGSIIMSKYVFGLFERFSTFSVVIFNAVLGICLYVGKFNN